MDSWVKNELRACSFADARLGARLHELLQRMSEGLGDPIPLACQDWACTKAAYRFLDNPRIDESVILSGHFEATRARFAALPGTVFVLHDTTEFSYQRLHPDQIGKTTKVFGCRKKDGRLHVHTVCGLLMHSSLVVTAEGLPLGLAAAKFWTRKKFKGTNALKKKINPTRVPIKEKESFRWLENVRQSTQLLAAPSRCVHIGDRESDIYELFCATQEIRTHFLVRTCVDRLAEDGNVTISEQMKNIKTEGIHCITVKDKSGESRMATLHIQYCRMKVLPPIGKQKHYPALSLTFIRAREDQAPEGRERIDWKLLTDLPVTCLADAIEKLDWYSMRWKIETFHKILKSGCKAEDSKLRTAERLINLLAIFCILSWRVFWLCMLNRTNPDAPARLVFTNSELSILNHLHPAPKSAKISHYLKTVARLGGYLARTGDPPPGNMVIWRGFSRLTDIHLGFTLAKGIVGN